VVGGSGSGFLYSSWKKTCVPGDGSEESDLSGGRFGWGGAEEVGISTGVSPGGEDGGGATKGGWDGGGAIAGFGAFGRKCGSAGFGFMSEGLRKRQRGDRFKIIGRAKAGESLENR